MTILENEIKVLFDLCENLNKTMKTVDLKTEHMLTKRIESQSKKVFQLMENDVNPMGVKIMRNVTNRNTLLKMAYVLLKCVILLSSKGLTKFEGPRSRGTYELSKKLFVDMGFLKNNLNNPYNWILNDEIYEKGLLNSMGMIHPTLLQNMIRCITNSLVLPEIQEKSVYNYLSGFEKYLLYYLNSNTERIYLDFI